MSMPEIFHIDEDDLIQYALGTLSQELLAQYSAHVSLCDECRGKLAQIQVELASFAVSAPLESTPSGAKSRFMARLEREAASQQPKSAQEANKAGLFVASRTAKPVSSSRVPLMVLSGALAAALAFTIYDDLSNIHKLGAVEPELARVQLQASELEDLKKFLHGSNTQQVSLHRKPPAIKAPEGHAIYSATSGKLVFTATNMPSLPAGKAYELWVLPAAGTAPVPAGLFTPDANGSGAVIFPTIAAGIPAGGFGLTIENAAGSATPTMPIVLSGQ
jgi:anti-sigma-K factor RskA